VFKDNLNLNSNVILEFTKEINLQIQKLKYFSTFSKTDSAGGNLELGARSRVENVEKYFMETFGIKAQISNADDTKLAENSMTLTQAGKL